MKKNYFIKHVNKTKWYCIPIFIRADFILRWTANKLVCDDLCSRPSLIQTYCYKNDRQRIGLQREIFALANLAKK